MPHDNDHHAHDHARRGSGTAVATGTVRDAARVAARVMVGLSTTKTALTAHPVHADQSPAENFSLGACRALNARFRIRHLALQMVSERPAAGGRPRAAGVV